MIWRVTLMLAWVPSVALASAWDVYSLCADRTRATSEVLETLSATGWRSFGEGPTEWSGPLDPDIPDHLAIIASAVGTYFPDTWTDADERDTIDSFLSSPYTTFFTSGDRVALERNGALVRVDRGEGRRECAYFGPATVQDIEFIRMPVEYRKRKARFEFFRVAPENQHFGSLVFGTSKRLKALLGVDMPDQVHVEVSVELIE